MLSDIFRSMAQTWEGVSQLPPDEAIQLASTLAAVLATLVAWRQLGLLRWQLKSDSIRHRREKTLDYSLVRSERYEAARDEIDRLFPPERWHNQPIPREVLQEVLDHNPQIRKDLARLFGHWENMALASAAKMADEDLAFEMVAGAVVAYTSRFREFLSLRRAENPRLYEYLIPLVDRWDTRLRRSGCRKLFW